MLELLRKSRRGGKGVGTYWWTVCDCGKVFEALGKYVRAGRVRSCGKCRIPLGVPRKEVAPLSEIPAGHREHYRNILRKLSEIDAVLALTPEMYTRLIGARCVGCGVRETHVELATPPQVTKVETHTELVPICRKCSDWRGGRNVEKWLEHCIRVAGNVIARHS